MTRWTHRSLRAVRSVREPDCHSDSAVLKTRPTPWDAQPALGPRGCKPSIQRPCARSSAHPVIIQRSPTAALGRRSDRVVVRKKCRPRTGCALRAGLCATQLAIEAPTLRRLCGADRIVLECDYQSRESLGKRLERAGWSMSSRWGTLAGGFGLCLAVSWHGRFVR